MKVPNVQTTKGVKPLTALPNEALVEGFLSFSENEEEKDLVRLIEHSSLSEKEAGSFLRECLTKGRKLVAVYPGLGQTPPANATFVCGIMEGSIYMV